VAEPDQPVTITSTNEAVEIAIPADAVAEPTAISITEMGGNFEVAAYDGEMRAANSYSIEPHGTTFDQPVEITFSWPDTDNDGFVDGTSLYEANLLVIKNNMVISPACSVNPACDMAANTVTVTVNSLSLFILAGPENQPPVAHISGPQTGIEGQALTFNASDSIDPEGGPVSLAWDTNADGQFDDGSGASLTFTFADNGSYPVSVRATDQQGLAAVSTLVVSVANAAPQVGVIIAPQDPKQINTSVSVAASISDPGTSDLLSAIWSWDDGTTSPAAISDGLAFGSHTYSQPGVYSVVLTAKDKDGATTTRAFNYIVIYDPSGGFVTGAGWIYSPRGAYLLKPDASGMTLFGFVSKYKKGASVPSGDADFFFCLGGFNFNATSYSWLVVNDSTAQFLGYGTMNGRGSYRFSITVKDGKLGGGADAYRIQIWNTADGMLVYDNQPGAALDAPATAAIGGGNIVIHK
jgi:PKD repeat protein